MLICTPQEHVDVITIVWKFSLDESDDPCPLWLFPMPKKAGVNKMLTVYGKSGLTGRLAALSLPKRSNLMVLRPWDYGLSRLQALGDDQLPSRRTFFPSVITDARKDGSIAIALRQDSLREGNILVDDTSPWAAMRKRVRR